MSKNLKMLLLHFRVYCTPCIELLAAEGAKTAIEGTQRWDCFLCSHVMPSVNGIIKPRPWSVILSRVCTKLFPVGFEHVCCDIKFSMDAALIPLSPKKCYTFNHISHFALSF
jgi:hypothetical protein